jgi:hypothetical protein
MATVGGEARQAHLAVVVVKCRVELVRPMAPAAIDDQHDVFAGCAEGRHDLLEIVAQLLGIKVWHDCVEDFGGAILACPHDTEPHAAGDPAPGAILPPRLPVAGQRPAPQDRFVFLEHNDLTPTGLIVESREVDRGLGEGRGGRRPVGREELRAFFSDAADALTAQLDAGRAGEDGRAGAAAPVGRDRAVLAGVLVHKALEGPCQRARDLRWAPGACALQQALGPLLRQALPPCPQGSMRHVEGRGDGRDMGTRDHRTDSLGTAKAPRLLGLLEQRVAGRERMNGKVAFEGAHRLAPWDACHSSLRDAR